MADVLIILVIIGVMGVLAWMAMQPVTYYSKPRNDNRTLEELEERYNEVLAIKKKADDKWDATYRKQRKIYYSHSRQYFNDYDYSKYSVKEMAELQANDKLNDIQYKVYEKENKKTLFNEILPAKEELEYLTKKTAEHYALLNKLN